MFLINCSMIYIVKCIVEHISFVFACLGLGWPSESVRAPGPIRRNIIQMDTDAMMDLIANSQQK